jgi:YD repeat-containing protein
MWARVCDFGRQHAVLTYDDASNVKTVTDAGETVTYAYDALDRLTGATGFAGGQTAAYAYNTIGNLTRKKEGLLDLTLAYPTAGSARPHATTSATFTGTSTAYKTLGYDANGNLSTADNSAYTFDAENRVQQRTYGAGDYPINPAPGYKGPWPPPWWQTQ